MNRSKQATQVYAELVDVAESIGYRATRPLEPAGLSLPQFHVLRILRDAGECGLLVHEVGDRMIARAPNITRLVDKLEKKGLVQRKRSNTDRRTVRLEITSGGRGLLKALEGPMEAELERAVSALSDGELADLRRTLGRLSSPGDREE